MALIGLDIVSGAAVIMALAFIAWRWVPDLWAASEWFWGEEAAPIGQYGNVVKTAASVVFLVALLGLGQNEAIKSLYYTYLHFGYAEAFDEEEFRRADPKARGIRAFTGMLGGSILTLLIVFILLPRILEIINQ
jgi:hypothetical protein